MSTDRNVVVAEAFPEASDGWKPGKMCNDCNDASRWAQKFVGTIGVHTEHEIPLPDFTQPANAWRLLVALIAKGYLTTFDPDEPAGIEIYIAGKDDWRFEPLQMSDPEKCAEALLTLAYALAKEHHADS